MDRLIGQTLSHYRILRAIGAGGMGVVYLAEDLRLEREVALKVLAPGSLSDDTVRKRFHKEALALSRLNHPNVATVHDFDTQNGVAFLVMEHVSGETLERKFQARLASESEILVLALDLTAGLAAAHAKGIVHRDLKPSNVRLTPDGRLKILDFGLAKLMDQTLRRPDGATVSGGLTETGTVTGTMPYISPEQARGEALDARSDLWGVGALLYEVATDRRAFPETRGALLIASILHEEPIPPRRLRGDLSPGLERIILKCLEKEPGARYASASELSADLTRLQTGHAPRAKAHRSVKKVIAISLLLATMVAGLALGLARWLRTAEHGDRIRSLAVLPLSSLSPSEEDEYFADGMTDELITTLAQLGALKVISRSSTMTYKNTHEKLPAIAKALHADAVLEGSVSRSGDRVRITAQLIRAATDQNVWARSYERDIRDVLALQSDVARSIAQEIRIALSPGERARLDSPRPVDPEAHAAYLRGLDAWNRRTTVWIERAMGHFQHAIAIDPTYAAPYAGLATCYSILPAYAPARAPEALAKARAAAYKALALDSTLAEPHAALGAVKSELDFDQRGAIAEFRRAIQLNPSYASAHHWYADQLSCMGLHQKALSEIRVAKELDPLSLIIATEEGHILGRSRQYDRGIEVLRNTIAVDPGFARAHGTLGTVYRWAGRYAEAIDESQAEDSLLGTFGSREATLAWYEPIRRALRSGGSEAFYRQLLKQRLARSRKVYVPALKFVIVYAALGQRDSAFVWLDRAAEAREPDILRLKVEPSYDSLRVDPRYATLIRRLGLEDH